MLRIESMIPFKKTELDEIAVENLVTVFRVELLLSAEVLKEAILDIFINSNTTKPSQAIEDLFCIHRNSILKLIKHTRLSSQCFSFH